jgi:hypothetical protein
MFWHTAMVADVQVVIHSRVQVMIMTLLSTTVLSVMYKSETIQFLLIRVVLVMVVEKPFRLATLLTMAKQVAKVVISNLHLHRPVLTVTVTAMAIREILPVLMGQL